MPREFTIYLPKKYRKNSITDMDFDLIRELMPEKYNELIKIYKETKIDNLLFVGIYKNNIVHFDCYKAINVVKSFTLKKHGFPIVIKNIVIADIDNIQASDINKKLHDPCTVFQDNENYPATYTFDVPV